MARILFLGDPADELARELSGLGHEVVTALDARTLRREVGRADVVHAHGLGRSSMLGLLAARRGPAVRVLTAGGARAGLTGRLAAGAAETIAVGDAAEWAAMAELAPWARLALLPGGGAAAYLRIYEETRAARATEQRIGFARFDLATVEKLPVVRRLLGSAAGPPAEPCLDIGIGTGFQTWRAFEGAFTIALDAWRPNLEQFRAGLGEGARARAAPIQASGERLPLRDGSIGTVLCSEVLEHLDDDAATVREIARVLRPGGAAVITVPSLYYGFDAYMHLVGMKTVHDFPGPERHVRLGYSEEDLRALLVAAGLEVERVEYVFQPFTKLAMEIVSVAHMAYQRLAHGRTSWAWSDAAQSEGGMAFRAYRLLLPALRALAAVDRVVPTRGGFGLAVRAVKR